MNYHRNKIAEYLDTQEYTPVEKVFSDKTVVFIKHHINGKADPETKKDRPGYMFFSVGDRLNSHDMCFGWTPKNKFIADTMAGLMSTRNDHIRIIEWDDFYLCILESGTYIGCEYLKFEKVQFKNFFANKIMALQSNENK